jgi:hypothetical protein
MMLRLLWQLTAGYRLRPWRSPYLRWRMETYWGMHAAEITFSQFWKLAWSERRELLRYLRWAGGMRRRADAAGRPGVFSERPVGAVPRQTPEPYRRDKA